jgi:hypothetical protein
VAWWLVAAHLVIHPPAGGGAEWATPLRAAMAAADRVVLLPPAPAAATYTPAYCSAFAERFAAERGGPPTYGNERKRPGEFRVAVVSAQGVGTTYTAHSITNTLGTFGWRTNVVHGDGSPLLGLKHQYPSPLTLDYLGCFQADRIIYMFGEPVRGVASAIRRSYTASAARPHAQLPPGLLPGAADAAEGLVAVVLNATAAASQRSDAELEALQAPLANMATYAAAVEREHRDLSGRHQHMQAWLAARVPCPILYIQFATLLEHRQLLTDFLAVPRGALDRMAYVENTTTRATPASQLTPGAPVFAELYANIYEQMRLYDRLIRLPSNYEDPPALAAGLMPTQPPPKKLLRYRYFTEEEGGKGKGKAARGGAGATVTQQREG